MSSFPKFVLKRSGDQFMFNLHAVNGEIVLTSERYTTKAAAIRGIASVVKNASKLENYKFKPNELHFILEAENGEPIGTAEVYGSSNNAQDGRDAVMRAAADAEIDDQTAAGT